MGARVKKGRKNRRKSPAPYTKQQKTPFKYDPGYIYNRICKQCEKLVRGPCHRSVCKQVRIGR